MTKPSDDTGHDPVREIFEAYRAAVFAKDSAAFAALYDERIRAFDLWGRWQYAGLAAWREMAAGWFGGLGDERVVVEFDAVESTVSPGLAVGHAFVTYRAVDATGAALRAMTNRLTLVLQRRAGGWKIVHEHSSAPIDPHSTKAILAR